MIGIVGDLHASVNEICLAHNRAVNRGCVAVIQVGDFGFYPTVLEKLKVGLLESPFTIPFYAIDGNHEDYRIVNTYATDVPTEVLPNLFYVPRGCVLDIDGRRIAFMGGAASVDKAWRLREAAYHGGVHWFPEEQIQDEEMARLDGVDSVDMLITHTPPHCTVVAHFPPHNLLYWGLPIDWTDPSAFKVQALWERLGKPMLYCGHFHKSVTDQMGKVRILNIGEMVIV